MTEPEQDDPTINCSHLFAEMRGDKVSLQNEDAFQSILSEQNIHTLRYWWAPEAENSILAYILLQIGNSCKIGVNFSSS